MRIFNKKQIRYLINICSVKNVVKKHHEWATEPPNNDFGVYLPQRWIKGFEAARAASDFSDGEVLSHRMGSAIFSSSNLLAIGFNTYSKSTPFGKKKTKQGSEFVLSQHAEHSAITKIKYKDYTSKKLVMYVFRANSLQNNASSKPCVTCQYLSKIVGISCIRYFNEHGIPEEMFFDN